jgi:hypothetical protein
MTEKPDLIERPISIIYEKRPKASDPFHSVRIPSPELSHSSVISGVETNQDFFAGMTPEQREQLRRICLLRS